ncbi:MAG: purine-nucleoside phosphorylase [Candidatus Omnitrophica bacterium]|nr:purine-nucleoside phosphorylase [Candidatus Omnitrophota bacterium]
MGAREATLKRRRPLTLREQLDESVEALRRQRIDGADTGIILGTGLGFGVNEALTDRIELPYRSIPHLPHSNLEGHVGRLTWGRCAIQRVVVLEGRVHCYEGYSAAEVAYATRLLARLGARRVIVTNIAGGLDPEFHEGDLMLITDHINLMGVNPLVGSNDDTLGPRFPDMSEPYSRSLLAAARAVAEQEQIPLREGVYVGVLGPNLETRAEYRFLRMIGADAVGMSTIPEVIAAVHAGMQVVAVSLITDRCIPETLKPVDVPKILQIARDVEPILSRLLQQLLRHRALASASGETS